MAWHGQTYPDARVRRSGCAGHCSLRTIPRTRDVQRCKSRSHGIHFRSATTAGGVTSATTTRRFTMTSCFRHTVILLLATTLIGCSSSAKKPIAAAEDPKQITTAAYDIRDLVANPLDSKVNEALAAELMKTIQQTIDAGNWNNQNTSIQYLSGQLIVKTTNQNHRQVVSLLGKLREASGIQVALESHVITVSKSRLKAIGVLLPPEPDGIAGTLLDADQVDHLLRAVRV